MMKILFSTMKYMHDEIRDEMINKFTDIYDKGWDILGEEDKKFEKEFAEYIGTRYWLPIKLFFSEYVQ